MLMSTAMFTDSMTNGLVVGSEPPTSDLRCAPAAGTFPLYPGGQLSSYE